MIPTNIPSLPTKVELVQALKEQFPTYLELVRQNSDPLVFPQEDIPFELLALDIHEIKLEDDWIVAKILVTLKNQAGEIKHGFGGYRYYPGLEEINFGFGLWTRAESFYLELLVEYLIHVVMRHRISSGGCILYNWSYLT